MHTISAIIFLFEFVQTRSLYNTTVCLLGIISLLSGTQTFIQKQKDGVQASCTNVDESGLSFPLFGKYRMGISGALGFVCGVMNYFNGGNDVSTVRMRYLGWVPFCWSRKRDSSS